MSASVHRSQRHCDKTVHVVSIPLFYPCYMVMLKYSTVQSDSIQSRYPMILLTSASRQMQ